MPLPISPNIQVKSQELSNAYRVINIEETFACWKSVVGVNSFSPRTVRNIPMGDPKQRIFLVIDKPGYFLQAPG